MRTDAAEWELDGPRMIGPMTSLKMLGGRGSEADMRPSLPGQAVKEAGRSRPECPSTRAEQESRGRALSRVPEQGRCVHRRSMDPGPRPVEWCPRDKAVTWRGLHSRTLSMYEMSPNPIYRTQT